MILQGAIQLKIDGRDIQANLDFDTGLIGFTEIVDSKTREYYYAGSPKDFKVALFQALESLLTSKQHLNFKVSRKNPDVMALTKKLTENLSGQS